MYQLLIVRPLSIFSTFIPYQKKNDLKYLKLSIDDSTSKIPTVAFGDSVEIQNQNANFDNIF